MKPAFKYGFLDPFATKKIIAIFPGESIKNPFMFYYVTSQAGPVWYCDGVGKKPVKVAENMADFKAASLRFKLLDIPLIDKGYQD
jgi:hypothetical protein